MRLSIVCLCLGMLAPGGTLVHSRPTEPFVISFGSPLRADNRSALRTQYGLRLDDYVAGQGYIEHLTAAMADRVATDFNGSVVARFSRPSQPPPTAPPTMGGDVRIRAIVWDDRAADALVNHFEHLNKVVYNRWAPSLPIIRDIETIRYPRTGIRPRVIARVPVAYEQIIRTRPEVRFLERLPQRRLDGDGSAEIVQSGVAGKTPLWSRNLGGAGQIVTVLDGGCVESNHCWFHDSGHNPGDAHRKLRVVRGGWPAMHATFVAGILGGYKPDNTYDRGHAWQSCIISIGGVTYNGAPVAEEFVSACLNGARIHTNSWHEGHAIGDYKYNALDAEIDDFLWQHEDHLVIGSAGNSFSVGPPATAKNALAVSASYLPPPPGEHNLHSAGATGPVGGRRKPDLVTPGCPVRSSLRDEVDPCWIGTVRCGTSWAAPAAAAAAAMVRQYFVTGWYPTGHPETNNRMTPSGSLLKAALIHSGQDMTSVPNFPSGAEGWGRVQLNRTLHFKDCSEELDGECKHNLWVRDVRHAGGLDSGQEQAYELKVNTNKVPLKVTLTWTDAPGKLDGSQALINDLDLTVTGQDGTFFGNRVVNGYSQLGGSHDRDNNVEVVVVKDPTASVWEIKVSAPAVNVVQEDRQGQGYSLVVTADLGGQPLLEQAPYYVEENVTNCSTTASTFCPR